MKTADLQGPLLDYWVARAEGIPHDQLTLQSGCLEQVVPIQTAGLRGFVNVFKRNYSAEYALGGPLIEKYELNTSISYSGFNVKSGYAAWSNDLDLEYGKTILEAVCRAVVRSKFGDEVEDI